uniref:Uncharacterized protein n=1 Tax=Anguilla anguilla TaxID=7936 RepID=A0A0E9XL85_ANGAN
MLLARPAFYTEYATGSLFFYFRESKPHSLNSQPPGLPTLRCLDTEDQKCQY